MKAGRCVFLFLSFLAFTALAQSQGTPIGEWREHLPYNNAISVADAGDRIYCATLNAIFYYDKEENSLGRITRINGLNDVEIKNIGYNMPQKTLVVLYKNSNIDLIKEGIIINMPDIISSNAITPEEKTLYKVIFINNIAYITCGFGIVVLDLQKEEITDTYYIGPDGSHLLVYDLAFSDSEFFAATENGIYRADRDNPNLAYYESWMKDTSIPFPDAAYNHIAENAGKVFVNKYSPDYQQDTILYLDGNTWKYSPENFVREDVMNMRPVNGLLYIANNYGARVFDGDLNLSVLIWTYNPGTPVPKDLTSGDDGLIWIADNVAGLVRRNTDNSFTAMTLNGPSTPNVYAIAIDAGALWTVPGGMSQSWGNIWTRGTLSGFTGESWTSYDKTKIPALDTLIDLLTVAIDPSDNNHVFAGSWFKGVIEVNDGQLVNVYNHSNSSLQLNPGWTEPVVQTGGMAFDGNGNLWVTNSAVQNILSVRIPDGTTGGEWHSFYLGSSQSGAEIGKIIIDSHNQKWILVRADHTIVVFNDNNTLTDISDDKVKVLSYSAGNGAIPGVKVLSIAEDHDGEVWIGTDAGVAVFYSPESIFSTNDFDAQRILVPRNDGSGLADILFEFEAVTAIAVDGNNDKWIGTDRSGVYLISDDGLQEYHHFTFENSPLLSNTITSIAIDHTTGEVFFGTSKGIISYKGEATGGTDIISDVYAYPNPVPPGYNGPIAIKGLTGKSDIRITDISGTLVYKAFIEGGQAVWNGKTMEGRQVRSGVYLVYISGENGEETHVTKIMVLN